MVLLPYGWPNTLQEIFENTLKREHIKIIKPIPQLLKCSNCFLPGKHFSLTGHEMVADYLDLEIKKILSQKHF